MPKLKINEHALALLIFLTFVIVVGLGPHIIGYVAGQIFSVFLVYAMILAAVFSGVAYILSGVLSKLVSRKLLVRVFLWSILVPLFFGLALSLLAFAFNTRTSYFWLDGDPHELFRHSFWDWFTLYPFNVILMGLWLLGIPLVIRAEAPSWFGYIAARIKNKRIITVYARSTKRFSEIQTPDRDATIVRSLGARYRTTPMGQGDTITLDDLAFPKDQEDTIEIIRQIAKNYGFEVRVVDLTRESTHKKINILPTLVSDSGKRLEGSISKEQIQAFLSQA